MSPASAGRTDATRASAGRVAAAYRSVDRATRTESSEPLWLPAGWLAVVLMLAAAAPSLGAAPASADGWRPRGTASRPATKSLPPRPIRQVAYEDDIAGPALRTAGRMPHDTFYDGGYRVAQQNAGDAFGDSLRESFERPFGVEDDQRPAGNRFDDAADEADRLFDDMPEEPTPADPAPTFGDTFDDEPSYEDQQQESRPGSLFDDEPRTTAEEIDPGLPADEPEAAEPVKPTLSSAMTKERTEAYQSCSEGLAELKANRLDSIDLSIGVTGSEGEDYPYVCSLEDGTIFAPRQWCEITYMWKASGLCHKPLYFEDVHLERYGHSWGPYVQPLVSGAHFFGTLPVLPYKMGLKAPNECVYTLGHYRPGNCAPYLLDPIPFTWRAALVQAGATVGVAAILP